MKSRIGRTAIVVAGIFLLGLSAFYFSKSKSVGSGAGSVAPPEEKVFVEVSKEPTELRGRYIYWHGYGVNSFGFSACHQHGWLEIVGPEELLSKIQEAARERSRKVGGAAPVFVEGTAVREVASRQAGGEIRRYRLTDIRIVTETIPDDCGFSPPNHKALGVLLFSGREPVDDSQFRSATAQEFELAKKQPNWPFAPGAAGSEVITIHWLRAYDLSKTVDGALLFISSGVGQMQPRMHYWFRRGTSMHLLGYIDGHQQIFKGREPGTITVRSDQGWCCASSQGTVDVYELKFDPNPVLARSAPIINPSRLVVPDRPIPPVALQVQTDNAELRSEPEVDDETYNLMTEVKGNVFARIGAGSKGSAYATHKDTKGETWWFVVLSADAKAADTGNLLNADGGKRSGWMSGRALAPVR